MLDGALSALVADEFPHAGESTYLNHAASSFIPRRSAAVLAQYATDRQRVYHLYQQGKFDFDPMPLRASCAQLLGCAPAEIALLGGTSDSVAAVLNAMDWSHRGRVVVPANEFPGVLYACRRLAAVGVDVVEVPPDADGTVPAERLLEAVDGRTRAVVASQVHWTTGARLDLDLLGAECRRRGVVTVIDAIQAMGNQLLDLSVTPVDIVVAATYKWLLGIPGAAVLRVPEWLLDEMQTPDRVGWLSVQGAVGGAPAMTLWDDARRFEVGTPSEAARMALQSSVELLLEVGLARIAAHCAVIADGIIEAVDAAGHTVLTPRAATRRGAIVSFTTGSATGDDALYQRLLAARIVVARRGAGLRVGGHLMNTMADVETFARAIR